MAKKQSRQRRDKRTSSRQNSKNKKIEKAVRYEGAEKEAETRTPADNDIIWWSKNPEMLRAAASLPFSQSIGTAVVVSGNALVSRKDDTAVPGLMTLNFVPTVGASEDRMSPVNLAAAHLYSMIRSHNSGATNYDAPNLMMYLLTMDGIFMYYSYLARIYGLMRLYSQRNRYLPRLLVEANGCDYDDLMGNLAQFRYFINQFAVRASSLCVPATMDYFRRHFWITQNVYKDEQTEKSQLYMFVPAAFPCYAGVINNKPTIAYDFPLRDDTKRTLSDLIAMGNALIQDVLTDADINIMSGDILKAYGEGNLFTLQPIPEDFVIVPVFSEEVLTQIHNANVLGIPSPEYKAGTVTQAMWNLNQVSSNVIDEMIVTGSNPTSYVYNGVAFFDDFFMMGQVPRTRGGKLWPYGAEQLLNSHKDDVTPEDVMIMTRLKVSARIMSNGAQSGVRIDSFGTEMIVNSRVYYSHFTTTDTGTVVESRWEPFSTVMTKAEFASNARFLVFQDHPLVTLIDAAPTSGTTPETIAGFIGDMDNYTTVAPEVFKRIHEAALLSAFDVPMLGQF